MSNILKRDPHRLRWTGHALVRRNAGLQGPNVAIIGPPREVARVAPKILRPVAMASILSLESTAAILPQSPGNSGTVDVRFPVPKYYQQYATQDGNPVPTTGRLFLLLPPNFDFSASLANSYRNRDQGSRTHRSFGCAVVSRRGCSGRLDRARHRCNGPPRERLSELETRTSGGGIGRGAS